MPITIDVAQEIPQETRNLENGVPLMLTSDQKEVVVMTKYITTNTQKADWEPLGEWFEQVTVDMGRRGRGRINVEGVDGMPRAVNKDDGLIIDLIGTHSGDVGMLPGRPPLSADQVEEFMDATEEPVPMYQQWDFRVRQILKTNGPEGRLNLNRSEDQKRMDAESRMFDTFTKMFQMGQVSLNAGGEAAPTPEAALTAGVKVAKGK